MRLEFYNDYLDPDYSKILFEKSCRERFHYVLHNARNFLLKYPNEPKYSMSWITGLAHRDVSIFIYKL